jgi:hypothetical protein
VNTTYVFHDFEYRQDGREVLVGCFWVMPDNRRVVIDFRRPEGAAELRQLVDSLPGAIWVAFAAMAELTCFAVLDVSTDGMKWLDLYAEARQITGTHRKFLVPTGNLLDTCAKFEIAVRGDKKHKDQMRDLILHQTSWTDAEWTAIVDYCWMDVEPLAEMLEVVADIHAGVGTPWEVAHAVYRAEYLKALAVLEYRRHGLPVDVAWLSRIFGNTKAIRRALAQRAVEQYGPVWIWNHVADEYSFNHAGLERFIAGLDYEVDWDFTDSGRFRDLSKDYLEELSDDYPVFKELKRTRATLAQLKTTDLREMVQPGGFIHPTSLPFSTVTSRNQPLVNGGYVLNMPPWLRSIIKPEPGWVLIQADWSQQEIVIAAVLSGDEEMLDALATGDVYLALGKKAGVIPPDGTKKSHPLERQSFKSVQLGLGYGMGVKALGRKVYVDLRMGGADITLEEAEHRAKEIHRWHQETFVDYWAFLNNSVREARRDGYCCLADGWTYFVDRRTAHTQLLNVPIQGNAAAMLREAIKLLAKTSLEVVTTLHDAIYVYCRVEDADRVENELVACMDAACRRTIGDRFIIGVECRRYTHEGGYWDSRGAATHRFVKEFLDQQGL